MKVTTSSVDISLVNIDEESNLIGNITINISECNSAQREVTIRLASAITDAIAAGVDSDDFTPDRAKIVLQFVGRAPVMHVFVPLEGCAHRLFRRVFGDEFECHDITEIEA